MDVLHLQFTEQGKKKTKQASVDELNYQTSEPYPKT